MSHEPHPRTRETKAGSTPTESSDMNVELEKQRGERELPGQPTTNPWTEPVDEDEERRPEDRDEAPRVDPSETVPDEVAREAARDQDPRTDLGGPIRRQRP